MEKTSDFHESQSAHVGCEDERKAGGTPQFIDGALPTKKETPFLSAVECGTGCALGMMAPTHSTWGWHNNSHQERHDSRITPTKTFAIAATAAAATEGLERAPETNVDVRGIRAALATHMHARTHTRSLMCKCTQQITDHHRPSSPPMNATRPWKFTYKTHSNRTPFLPHENYSP